MHGSTQQEACPVFKVHRSSSMPCNIPSHVRHSLHDMQGSNRKQARQCALTFARHASGEGLLIVVASRQRASTA